MSSESVSVLFTQKERARLKKVREMLAAGESPYADSHKNQLMGSSAHLDKKVKPKVEVSKTEVRRRQKRWSERVEGGPRKTKFRLGYPNSPAAFSDFEIVAAPLDPSKIHCSFCGIPIPRIMATVGNKIGWHRKVEVTELPNGSKVFEERMTPYAKKTYACYDCCRKVRNQIFPTDE